MFRFPAIYSCYNIYSPRSCIIIYHTLSHAHTQALYSRSHIHACTSRKRSKTRPAAIAKNTGCKQRYSLMKLPCHNRITQTVPDCMHTLKDVIEKVFQLLTGSEDTMKARNVEMKSNRFNLSSEKGSQQTPCYSLSKSDIKLADDRLSSVILPLQDFTPSRIFSRPFGLKSHDWKEVHV